MPDSSSLPEEEQQQLKMQEYIINYMADKPEKTAAIVKAWMSAVDFSSPLEPVSPPPAPEPVSPCPADEKLQDLQPKESEPAEPVHHFDPPIPLDLPGMTEIYQHGDPHQIEVINLRAFNGFMDAQAVISDWLFAGMETL